MDKQKIAVIGAGAVGLATAVQLQISLTNASITIIGDRFNEETTSFGAAGLFRPINKSPGVSVDLMNIWLKDSWTFFSQLARSEDAGEAGCQIINGYEFYNSEQDNSGIRDFTFMHEKITDKQTNLFIAPEHIVAYRATTTLTSPRKFLVYLMKQFKSNGGVVQQRKLETLEELVGQFDVVVNCTGLGARELVNDENIYASRGHVIHLKAPWIKNYIYAEENAGAFCQIYPTPEYLSVGGVRQINDENLTPRESDRNAILKRATQLIPSLKYAEVLGEWVGLRPMRRPIRVEPETMRFKNGELKVVHNYGHGGKGISLSWGSGAHAVRLVQRFYGCKTVSKY